jgi:hypothetical protein
MQAMKIKKIPQRLKSLEILSNGHTKKKSAKTNQAPK